MKKYNPWKEINDAFSDLCGAADNNVGDKVSPAAYNVSATADRVSAMDALKKRLADACERKLEYYDVVNECGEQVEYGMIIDFLFEEIAALMIGRDEE